MPVEAVVAVTELYAPEFFVGRSETVTRSAMVVVPIVRDLLAPQSVLDLGCGQGEWLDAFGLEDARGIDIAAPFQHMRRDLTDPLYLGRTFDLVVCLEVAEHLPVEAVVGLAEVVEVNYHGCTGRCCCGTRARRRGPRRSGAESSR